MAARFEHGAGRRALWGVCLCLMLACGRRPVLVGGDGAADAGPDGGAVDHLAPPPADGGTDTLVLGPDAADGGRDGAREVAPDVVTAVDAPLDAPPDGPPPCPVDCSHLPHVRAGVVVGCSAAGFCTVPPGSCESGFDHCSNNPNDGCEADLSRSVTCGSCFTSCYVPFYNCVTQNGSHFCGQVCQAPYPDTCGGGCTDLKGDSSNCGACGHSCYLPNAFSSCVQSQCTPPECSNGYADCTSDPGCETVLGTDLDCAGCGDRSCALANTVFTCSSANSCASAVCAAGYANCDATGADCEASFAAGGTCLPNYVGTFPLATQVFTDAAAVIATDGSYFLAGEYSGLVDFDPTSAQDVRSPSIPNDIDGFITKINADGSYAWTRTFGGRGSIGVHGLAAAAGGAVVAVGGYGDSVDLDPGTGADLHQTASPDTQEAFVVKLAGDGSFVWGKTFVGMANFSTVGNAVQVAVDGADAVYLAGDFQSTVDFDPGPATALRTSPQQSGMLVKLTAAGAFAWVQTIDNTSCTAVLRSVTVGSDGAVWSVGAANTAPNCGLGSPSSTFSSNETLIVSYTAAGASRGTWSLGSGSEMVYGLAVTAGPSGSVYIGGQAQGRVDFDPGPGEAIRWVPSGSGGFILKIGSDAGFKWVQTLDVGILSVAGTPDGGVLGAGVSGGAFVTRLGADGTAVWTFASGAGQTTAATVTSRGTSFAIAGTSSGSGDFDPGPGVDVVFGDIVYVSRFTF